MIEQQTIEKIYDSLEVVDVVSDFVQLKKRGVNYLGLCPFHNEKTPSFTVSPAKGIYKCFGCGKGGNAVNFVMDVEHMSYAEALKYLGKKYGIEVVEKQATPEEAEKKDERESMLVLSGFAQTTFSNNLFNHEEGISVGLSYLKERGFRKDVIEKFQLGYALDQRDSFARAALKNGYKKEFLVKTGLCIERDTNIFDRFSGRVIFPIHALSGKVSGFGGRILRSDKKTAKYLNSPESEIYHKSKILYGIFQARKSIVEKDKCYLTEGYTDVLSLHQHGIENVVASSGTSLTQEQVRLVKRFTNNLTVIYDGDEAGIKASLRGIDIILEEGMNVNVIPLPEGEDPDSFAKSQSFSALEAYIQENENNFILFKTGLLLSKAGNDPVKRATLISDIVRSIAMVPDAIIRAEYIREVTKLLETKEEVIYSEVGKARRKKLERKTGVEKNTFAPAPDIRSAQEHPPSGNEFPIEREIIRILLHYGDKEMNIDSADGQDHSLKVAKFIVNEILADELELEHPVYKRIFKMYSESVVADNIPTERFFTTNAEADISHTAADLLGPIPNLSKIWLKNETYVETEEMKLKFLVPQCVMAFKGTKVKKMLDQVKLEFQAAQKNNDSEGIKQCSLKLMALNNLKRSLSKEMGNRIIF